MKKNSNFVMYNMCIDKKLYTNRFAINYPSLKLIMSLIIGFLLGFQFAFSQCPDPQELPERVCQNSILDFSDYLDDNVDGIWHLITNPSGTVPPTPFPNSFNTAGNPQGVYEFTYIPTDQALATSCAPLPTYPVQVLPDADPIIIVQQDVFCEAAIVDLDTIVLIGASNINTTWYIVDNGSEFDVAGITADGSNVWDFGAFAVANNSLTFKVVVTVNGTTCTSELEFAVSLGDEDITDFSYPDPFCENDVYDPTLGPNSSPNGTYSFAPLTPPNPEASLNPSTGRISGLEEGFYTVFYETFGDCANRSSETIQVTRKNVVPVDDIGLCSGDDVDLLTDITVGQTGGNWVSFPGMNALATTSFTNLLSDQQFFYQFEVPGVCVTGDTLDITIINETNIVFSNTVCNNDNTFNVDVEIGNVGQNYPISINPPVAGFITDIDGGTSTNLNLPNDTYTITVIDATMGINCETVSDSFTNSCGCPEGLSAMADETLCSDETIALTATLDVGPLSAIDLTWTDADGAVILDPDNYLPPFVSGCDPVEYVITVDGTCIDDNSDITNTDNTLTLTVYPPILPPTLVQVADPVVDCKYEIATACTDYVVEDDNGNPISSIDLNENDPVGTIDLVVTQTDNICPSWTGTLNYDECTACPEENFTTSVNLDIDTELNLDNFINEEIAGSYACETCPTASVFNGTAAVDFAGGDLGEYLFSYTFDSPAIGCPDAQYLTVNVVDNSSINAANANYVCTNIDKIVDLEDYLESTNTSSFWMETSPTPSTGTAFNPTNGTFNTDSQANGSYQFAYITTGSTDTVFVDIILIAPQDIVTPTVTNDRYICPGLETTIIAEGYPNAVFSWYTEITPPDSVEITTGISGVFNETLVPELAPGNYFLGVIQDIGGCKSPPAQFGITFFEEDPAGNFSILHLDSVVCSGNFVDLAGFASSNTGGTFRYFSEDISTANEIPSVVTITTDTTFIIEHETEYPIGAISEFCVDSFIVNITTPTALTLDVDNDLKSVCNLATIDVTILDFTAFVNDPSGGWSAPTGQEAVDLTDFTNVDFNGLTADTLTFIYTIDGGGSCLSVTDTLRVEVKECTCPNVATVAPTEDVCQGSSFNLNILLDNVDQSGTGSWSIVNQVNNTQPAAMDNDSIFNSTGAALGDYTIQFTNINAPLQSCPDSSIQVITVSAGELAGTGRDTTLCANIASYDLNFNITDANVSGMWSADPANSSNGTIGPLGEIFPNTMDENGNYLYYFTVSNNSCKDDTARIEVNIISQATAVVATQSNACNEVGNITTLNFRDFITAGDTTGIWTDVDGAGVNLSDIKNVNFESIVSGNYVFNYSLANNPCGGANYDVSITVDGTNCADCLNYEIKPLDPLCSGGGQRVLSNKLTVNSLTTSLPGSWSIEPDPTKANPPVIRIDTVDNVYVFVVDDSEPGEYTLVFSLDTIQPATCDTFKKTTINVVDPPNAGISAELSICNTEDMTTDLFAELQVADPGGDWIQLSGPDPGINLDTAGTFSFLSLNARRGTYVYQYSIEGTGCPVPSTSEITLYVDGEYDFDVLSNINICETLRDSLYFDLNSLITINDTGVFTIPGDWDDLDFINAGNPIINFNVVEPGNYSFEFTLKSDCNAQPQYVDITLEECTNYIFIPSAFSPNNDGLNDYLEIFGSKNISTLDLKVFNRWGQMMFESNQMESNWDGLFNKVEAPIGVYTYFIKVVFEDGQTEEKVGDVTLIR